MADDRNFKKIVILAVTQQPIADFSEILCEKQFITESVIWQIPAFYRTYCLFS